MPIIAQTKNLSVTLGETQQLLAEAWVRRSADEPSADPGSQS